MIGSVACPLGVTGRVVLGSRAVEPAAVETLMLMAPLTTYNNVIADAPANTAHADDAAATNGTDASDVVTLIANTGAHELLPAEDRP
jgi:hypothetical protein